MYRHKLGFEYGSSSTELRVVEALGATPEALRDLWAYLLAIDWIATVKASLLPPDHPLFLLLATPRRLRYRMGDGLWVRAARRRRRTVRTHVRERRQGRVRRGRRVLPVERGALAARGRSGHPEQGEAGPRAAGPVARLGPARRRFLRVARRAPDGSRSSRTARSHAPTRCFVGTGTPGAQKSSDPGVGTSGPDARLDWRAPGRLAQLGEHQLDKLGVTGSSPVPPIRRSKSGLLAQAMMISIGFSFRLRPSWPTPAEPVSAAEIKTPFDAGFSRVGHNGRNRNEKPIEIIMALRSRPDFDRRMGGTGLEPVTPSLSSWCSPN